MTMNYSMSLLEVEFQDRQRLQLRRYIELENAQMEMELIISVQVTPKNIRDTETGENTRWVENDDTAVSLW